MQNIIDFNDLTPIAAEGADLFGAALSALSTGGSDGLAFGRLAANGNGATELAAALVVVVRSGRLKLAAGGESAELEAGQAAAIGKGTALRWQAEDAELIVICDRHATQEPGLSLLDLTLPLSPSAGPAAALLRSAPPECASHGFRNEGEFTYGLWSATPYDRAPVTYGHSELMFLLDGAVELYDEAGDSRRFEAGDIFIVLAGAVAGWRNEIPVRKLWVTLSRA